MLSQVAFVLAFLNSLDVRLNSFKLLRLKARDYQFGEQNQLPEVCFGNKSLTETLVVGVIYLQIALHICCKHLDDLSDNSRVSRYRDGQEVVNQFVVFGHYLGVYWLACLTNVLPYDGVYLGLILLQQEGVVHKDGALVIRVIVIIAQLFDGTAKSLYQHSDKGEPNFLQAY